MYACIVCNSKYSKLQASVSQTMGRDAHQAAKRLRIVVQLGGLSFSAIQPPSHVTKKINL